MHLCALTVDKLSQYLDAAEVTEIIRLAKKAQTIEDKWRIRTESFYRKSAEYVADSLDKGLTIDVKKIDFESLFVEHAFDVMFEAFDSTKRMPRIPRQARLRYPQGPMPRSLKQLMVLWDLWRKKKEAPPRQKAIANKIKKKYLQKVQEITKTYNDRARQGEVIDKSKISNMLMDRSKAEAARSKTIVETETTRYWNTIRRDTYDESPDVTHYIFVSIRDAATTKWCRTRTGLVYAKGDPILDRETPPIHWNCRSEILPLTAGTFLNKKTGHREPINPKHYKLAHDPTLQRRYHSPEPLPPGWNR